MVNPWFSRTISTKKQQSYHCRPLKPHTGSNQPWPLIALKGSKMVNPGLAQVIQHKDICHTIIDRCSSENYLPSKIQPPKAKIQNLNSKLQNPRCTDIVKKIFWNYIIIVSKIQNQNSKFQNQNSKIQNQNSKIQNQNSKIQIPKPKLQNPNSKIQNPNSKIQNPNSKIKTPRSKIKTPRSAGKLENGQHVHIIVSRYCNVQSIVLLDVFEGRMLKGIAKYAYQHEGGENHSRPLVSEPGVGLKL